MRIVDARSGEVLDARKGRDQGELAEPAATDQLITMLADAYADQTVVNLMNAIYPIKVAAVVSVWPTSIVAVTAGCRLARCSPRGAAGSGDHRPRYRGSSAWQRPSWAG